MVDNKEQEIIAIKELKKLLTPQICIQLQTILSIPDGIMERTRDDPVRFIYALKDWEGLDTDFLDEALLRISGSIHHVAKKIDWRSGSHQKQQTSKELSVKSFIRLLKVEMISEDWLILIRTETEEIDTDNIEANEAIRLLVRKRVITRELRRFCKLLEALQRDDLAQKVRSYREIFGNLTNIEFYHQIMTDTKLMQQKAVFSPITDQRECIDAGTLESSEGEHDHTDDGVVYSNVKTSSDQEEKGVCFHETASHLDLASK